MTWYLHGHYGAYPQRGSTEINIELQELVQEDIDHHSFAVGIAPRVLSAGGPSSSITSSQTIGRIIPKALQQGAASMQDLTTLQT